LALTDFQVEVAQLFFSLPAASGFLLGVLVTVLSRAAMGRLVVV
jgi:hypothetical protein